MHALKYTEWCPSKALGSVGRGIVTLIVGPSKTPFYVDKSLLCECVDFFNKAFNGDFKEAKASRMDLPDDKPPTIQNFLMWLYSEQSIHDIFREWHLPAEGLLELFMLAEKWTLKELQEDVYERMDVMFSFIENIEVCRKYWRLAKDSRIRFIPLLAHAQRLAQSIDNGCKDYTTLKQTIGDDIDFLQDFALCQAIFDIPRDTEKLVLPDDLQDFLDRFR